MKKTLSLLLALGMLMALCACGSSQESTVSASEASSASATPAEAAPEKEATPKDASPSTEPEAPVVSDLAGYYEITRLVSGDETIEADLLHEIGIDGSNTYIFLDSDGVTGVLAMEGEEDSPFTREEKQIISEGEGLTYTLENQVFTLYLTDSLDPEEMQQAEQMVFTWVGMEKPEPKAASEPETESDMSLKDRASEPHAGDISLDPVSGDLGPYHIDILGAEPVRTYEDKPAIRVYYEFTNNSEEITDAWMETVIKGYQDGKELDSDFSTGQIPEYSNEYLKIQPGITIRCVEEFTLNDETTLVHVIFNSLWETGEVSMWFDPQNLQGRPAEDWTFELIPEPEWDDSLPLSGTDITLDMYDFVEDDDGNPMLRIYYIYTNNSQDTPDSFFFSCDVLVMQDGIELDSITFHFNDQVPEDENTMTDVEPGETIHVAECYQVRTDSPITIQVTESNSDDVIGAIIYPGAEG